MNTRILANISVIVAVAAIAIGGTVAYFGDTETSAGNTFTAGSIDLKVDNECYYNGVACILTTADGQYHWNGDVNEDVCTCTWESDDLDDKLFINLADLKPGDLEEDTVSLYVDNNPSWICANIKLTKNDDITCTEPELGDDATCDEGITPPDADLWDGDLAQNLNFVFWADDGDNVLEDGEKILLDGPASGLPLGDGNAGLTYPIVDSTFNAFGNTGDPFPGAMTKYIGKAFCFGTLTQQPEAQIEDNDPTQGAGVLCDGAPVNNASQSDSMMGDVSFSAIQSKNNPDYVCEREEEEDGTVTVTKVITNDNGGSAVVADFSLFVGATQVTSGQANQFAPGSYDVTEQGPANYAAAFSGDCAPSGHLNVVAGHSYSCTITNDDVPATLKIVKTVVNDNGGSAVPGDFGLKIDGNAVANNTAVAVAPGAHVASETGLSGYTASAWGGDCDANGNVSVNLGDNLTCTITNDDQPALLVINKQVTNNNGGNNSAGDFQLTVDGGNVANGASNAFAPGQHTVSETGVGGYVASFGDDCDADGHVTLVLGQTKTCTITNDDLPGFITLIKHVINDSGGTATANDFVLRIDGVVRPNNSSVSVSANSPHSINEDAKAGYHFHSITGSAKCPAVLGGTATLDEGESITCTIENDDD